jgi:hypothetical protein
MALPLIFLLPLFDACSEASSSFDDIQFVFFIVAIPDPFRDFYLVDMSYCFVSYERAKDKSGSKLLEYDCLDLHRVGFVAVHFYWTAARLSWWLPKYLQSIYRDRRRAQQ